MPSSDSRPPSPTTLVPLHAVTRDAAGNELVVKRRPGRPKAIRPQPSATEADYIEAINNARDGHINADPLVGVIQGRGDADHVVRQIMKALALESASLAWEIRQGRDAGKDVSQYCTRRIDALSKLAHVELGRRKLGIGDDLDPAHPKMIAIVNFFLSTVTQVLEETLTAPKSSHVCELIENQLRDWAKSGTLHSEAVHFRQPADDSHNM